ncbi:hypothetical protein, partial [Weizmannia acidilactici]|uniref:hypothetical protein n=1 Tax=Weizmannia acidilactici TaxID=2607726 RepID=UPI001C12C64C
LFIHRVSNVSRRTIDIQDQFPFVLLFCSRTGFTVTFQTGVRRMVSFIIMIAMIAISPLYTVFFRFANILVKIMTCL